MEPNDVQATKMDEIRVSTNNEAYICDITGSDLMAENWLVLTDFDNSTVKLLNLETSMITSVLETSSKPWDVARITEDQVAVTVCDARKIVFVKVTSDLEFDREISVDGNCTGILYNDGKLIVAFCEPVKIETIDLDGSVKMKIECSGILKWPSHLALNQEHDAIYVTDWEGHCIKRLSLGGIVETECKEQLTRPRGVIVDQQGRVLVCGEGLGNIYLLTPDLTKIKLLVDGLYMPTCISLCDNTNTLYVGIYPDEDIIVYQLS